MKTIEMILKDSGITVTPVRILVYRRLQTSEGPMSLSDLETDLESVDKSTISRTLAVFKDKHLIHSFNDGSGSVKYEICNSGDLERDNDRHVHFRCNECGATYCLQELKVPEVSLPEGFIGKEINYVVTGICARCGK